MSIKLLKGIDRRKLFALTTSLPMLIFSGYVWGLAVGNIFFKVMFDLPIIVHGNADVMHFYGWIVVPIGLGVAFTFSHFILLIIPLIVIGIIKKYSYLVSISTLLFIISGLVYFSPLQPYVVYASYELCSQCGHYTGINWFAWLPFI